MSSHLGAGQPGEDAAGGDLPHVIHGGQLLQGGVLQGLHGLKPGGQDLARLLPHLADAKGVDQPGQVLALGPLNGGHEILGRLLAHAVQPGHVLLLQEVQVAGGLHQSGVHQVFDDGHAQAVDPNFNIETTGLGKRAKSFFNVGRSYFAKYILEPEPFFQAVIRMSPVEE